MRAFDGGRLASRSTYTTVISQLPPAYFECDRLALDGFMILHTYNSRYRAGLIVLESRVATSVDLLGSQNQASSFPTLAESEPRGTLL